jgi:nitroreductase
VDKLNIREYRTPDHDIDPIFLNRWSPRAMSGETIATEQLMSLFEAARWAPSSYNGQLWRFLYAPGTVNTGSAFSIYWLRPTKNGPETPPC